MNPLSQNFHLSEFLRSQTAARHDIDMTPTPEVVDNLRRLCTDVLQPLRDALGPVHITSGYRPPKLNRLIGGSTTSQHVYGHAADLVVTGHTPLEVSRWIRDHLDTFDQVIHEFGEWVHVSVPAGFESPRRQALTAVISKSALGKQRTIYTTGLLEVETPGRVA